jgi:hypothetical protein
MQPLCILPLKTMPDISEWMKEFYVITGQSSGWIDTTIWENWITSMFIKHVNYIRASRHIQDKRALLIVDGHSTRASTRATKALEDANVDLLILPAHSSTILQPLDLTCNGIFKQQLAQLAEQKKTKLMPFGGNSYLGTLLRHWKLRCPSAMCVRGLHVLVFGLLTRKRLSTASSFKTRCTRSSKSAPESDNAGKASAESFLLEGNN